MINMNTEERCKSLEAKVPPLYIQGQPRSPLRLFSYEPHALLDMVLPFFTTPLEDLPRKRLEAREKFLLLFGPKFNQDLRKIPVTVVQAIMESIDRFFFYGLLTEGSDPFCSTGIQGRRF